MIYVYDMQVKDRPRLLTSQDGNGRAPVWSPDGSRIAFSYEGKGSQEEDIHVRDADGTAPPVRLLELEGAQVPLDWISEGRMLIEHQGDPWILDLPGQGSAVTAVARPFFESEDENRGMSVDPRRRASTGARPWRSSIAIR